MSTQIVPAVLKTRLGTEASEGLVDMFAAYQEFSTDRYERRLNQEIAGLRLELHDGLSGIRQDMANVRADLMKWTLLLWLGQFAAITAVLSLILRGR
ncbi:MAG TPA: hypothetical protein VGF24_00310 [Vicinamibacterales bacterium]|jgi:hypothetical protein